MHGAGRYGRELGGTIALLVSMAFKADIAAGRSFPVRWLVLFFLRMGERVAQDYVARALDVEPADLEDELAPVAAPGDASPADAVLIAWRLRWYAAVLAALLNLLDDGAGMHDRAPNRATCRDGRLACRGGALPAMAGGAMSGFTLPWFHDTS